MLKYRTNRNRLYTDFVKNGCPGIKLKPDYDRIMRSIIIPRIILDELNVQEENLVTLFLLF